MKIYCLSLLLLVLGTSLSAQRLSLPSDVAYIMRNSKLEYKVDTFGYKGMKPSLSDNGQLKNHFSRTEIEGEVQLDKPNISYSKKIKKSIKVGDKRFKKGKYAQARECYKKAYDQQNSLTVVINKVAETYVMDKDYGSAAYWYERSLEYNEADTEALRGAARAYKQLGDDNKAFDYIFLAHIFNRNNKEIAREMQQILSKKSIKYKVKQLIPVYEVQKNGKTVTIKSNHPIWSNYAAIKALWKYEPKHATYQATMSKQSSYIVQEKEALLNALVAYEYVTDKNKDKKYPLFALLKELSPINKVDDFVIYELVATQRPELMLELPMAKLNKLKQYVVNYRRGL